MSASAQPALLLWVDLETEGLDPLIHGVLEIAVAVTRFEAPYEVLHAWSSLIGGNARRRLLDGHEDAFIVDMHARSGLTEALTKAPFAPTPPAVDKLLVDFLGSGDWPLNKNERAVLAGFSVDFDRRFLRQHFPMLASVVSHRVFDISAFRLMLRSAGVEPPPRPAQAAHRAKDDLEAALSEARAIAARLSALPKEAFAWTL